MKPVALAEVRRFRHCLTKKIDVVGCGGVQCGRDVYDMLLVGASVVQVGSTLMREGPTCFARLHAELVALMRHKHVAAIGEVPVLSFNR